MKDKIFVVTHKKIKKQINKTGYSYIQVNTKLNGNLGFEYKDSSGKNISEKNPNYCELTALYWIWKNYKCNKDDIVGLCHYRRFFVNNIKSIIGIKKIKKILTNYEFIVPKKFNLPMTTYDYYYKKGAGKEKDLKNIETIISKMYPEYLESVKLFFNQRTGYYCNMMICKKSLLDDYCKWLFDILFELEKKTDLSSYSKSEARIYGYLSELLLNVYIIKNQFKIKELQMVNVEEKLSYKLKNKICKVLKKIGGIK